MEDTGIPRRRRDLRRQPGYLGRETASVADRPGGRGAVSEGGERDVAISWEVIYIGIARRTSAELRIFQIPLKIDPTCARDWAPSFCRTCSVWVRAVCGLIESSVAI